MIASDTPNVKTPDGKFLVQGKEVTGFTNGEEEEAVGHTKVVPLLVEDEMSRTRISRDRLPVYRPLSDPPTLPLGIAPIDQSACSRRSFDRFRPA